MVTEEEVKALIASAAQTIFEEIAKGVQPIQEAARAIQLDLIALRLATYQLAAIVASRYPDGQQMIRVWLESTIKLVDTIALNDEGDQTLPAELEEQIRSELRKKLQVLAQSVFDNMK